MVEEGKQTQAKQGHKSSLASFFFDLRKQKQVSAESRFDQITGPITSDSAS